MNKCDKQSDGVRLSLLTILTAALSGGCGSVESGDLAIFLQDLALNATAAFLL